MTEVTLLRPRAAPQSAPTRSLIRAGAESSLIEEFRALAEATAPTGEPRYSPQTLDALARFIVRGSASTNRDAALFELCHLVSAVDAGSGMPDRRNAFFLAPEAASPARFKARFEHIAAVGWRRAGFTVQGDGVAIRHADVSFAIHYSRMPFLAALYEFLSGLESFAFYSELQAIFAEMSTGGMKALQAASNRIASRLRQYRRHSLATAQHEGKFDAILAFLKARSPASRLNVVDDSILDFWCAHAATGDFRAYRTVFEAFAMFVRALEESHQAEAITAAQPIGMDRAAGEVEPDDTAALLDADEWSSPLMLLDEEPAASIKFFKKEGERKPIEALMQYGPFAVRLPLALLRLETFGPIQSAITTDLQVGRARSLPARIACVQAIGYRDTVALLTQILELVRRFQKATFYALHSCAQENCPADDLEIVDPARLAQLMAEARKVFHAIARKGFDEAGLNDAQRLEGFRVGAGVLVTVADQMHRYLSAVRSHASEEKFATDRMHFSRQFGVLYGVDT